MNRPSPSLTSDALSVVFLSLPLKTLFRCKAVCKLWESVISDPSFAALYRAWRSAHLEYAGVFCSNYFSMCTQFVGNGTISAEEIVSAFHPRFSPSPGRAYICASSSGVLLACTQEHFPSEDSPSYCYYLCNPLTKEWRALPLPPTPNEPDFAVGFICWEGDPSAAVGTGSKYEYEVVRILRNSEVDPSSVEIETYTSKSNKWLVESVSSQIDYWAYPGEFHAMVIGGVFYWVEDVNMLMAYCPTTRRLEQVPSPPVEGIESGDAVLDVGEGADGALLGYVSSDEGFDVWVQCDPNADRRLFAWRKKCSLKWVELAELCPPSIGEKLFQSKGVSVNALRGFPEKVLVSVRELSSDDLGRPVLFSYELRSEKLELLPDAQDYFCHYYVYHTPSWHFWL